MTAALSIAVLVAAMATAGQGMAACTAGDPRLAGLYVLEGEREVGAELILRPDGSFEFGLAYGAIDQYGRGCWSLSGGALTLLPEGRRRVPAQHSPADRRFRGMELHPGHRGDLRWPLPGFRGVFRKARG